MYVHDRHIFLLDCAYAKARRPNSPSSRKFLAGAKRSTAQQKDCFGICVLTLYFGSLLHPPQTHILNFQTTMSALDFMTD